MTRNFLPSFDSGLGPALVPAALAIGLAILGSGCGGDDQAAAGQGQGTSAQSKSAGNPAGASGANGRGGPPAGPATPVAVAIAARGPIASYYSATATLEAEKQAQILARVSGVVTSIQREEGDRVRAGEQLLEIEDDEYRLRKEQTAAVLATQRARHDRLQGMWQENLVSAEEYDAIKSDLETAGAEAALAELNLSYTRVTAPFTGKVVRRVVDVGQNVSPGTPLFDLADFDPLLARVHVPSKEFRSLRPDQVVRLGLDSDQRRLEGRITLISPVIDPQSGTIKVTVEIPEYPEGTRPGDFAEVNIVTEVRDHALLVPKIALVTDKSEQVVYVVSADSTAVRRVVEVGFQDEDNAEIRSGVEAGESVVVRGQRSLKPGARVKILEDTLPGTAGAGVAGS
jgi:membrane fusion protein (multidrug efflux system)